MKFIDTLNRVVKSFLNANWGVELSTPFCFNIFFMLYYLRWVV
jgi:hypothetical protein